MRTSMVVDQSKDSIAAERADALPALGRALSVSSGVAVLGFVLLDGGVQAVHVASRGVIYLVALPSTGLRVSGYMILFSIGSYA